VMAIVTPVIAFVPACLWVWLLAPAVLRAFGVPMVYGPWPWNLRHNQHLSKRQYLWGYGVFTFGTGMFLFSALRDFLAWRMRGDLFSHPTPARIVLELVIWLGVGLTVGAYGAPERKA